MKPLFASFFRQLLFWMLLFAAARITFIFYNISLLAVEGISLLEAMASFWYALPLDLATACYILLIPFIILLFQGIFGWKWLYTVNLIYTSIGIILFSLLITTELGIYAEWKTKLPLKALMYLKNPAEVYDSASTSSFIILTCILLFFIIGGIWLFKKLFCYNITQRIPQFYIKIPIFIALILPLLVLGARGGWQQIPINQSQSYYSNHNILNLAAVNSAFNFSINIIENYKNIDKNPFQFYPINEAKQEVINLYTTEKDTTINVLKHNRPNIVILILESWSADLIESMGGKEGITPEFRELEKKGILFTNLYATGPRSEQAMGSIFSGFPAHPISSVTVQPDKFSKLPTITNKLINIGYHTSFYFGGQLRYGNIKGYILYNGFKRVIEHTDFSKDVIKGKLGVHDEFVLERQLSDLNKEKEPFFSGLFTLSTHSPYDQPMEQVLDWGGNEKNYINSAYYTDRCLGNYFREASKQKWYKNTLFIIVADHSHNSYRNWSFTTPFYHKIPFLLYGEVIKDEFKGLKFSRLSNQSDLASTLLKQLNLDNSEFKWSRNLFNPYSPEFTYYSFEEGMGWVTKNGHFVYEPRTNHYSEDSYHDTLKEAVHKQGKSFLQVLFDEYMNL